LQVCVFFAGLHCLLSSFVFVAAQGELQEAKQSLFDKLGRSPELDRLLYKLNFVQCMYLLSIYRLESLR